MKTLKFNVNGQTITLDPESGAEKLVPGSKAYVMAEFTFSEEWDKCSKVVAFYSNLGREFEPQVLKDGKLCVIPLEATNMSIFKVKVFGKREDFVIGTNKVVVHQKGVSV